jgi:DNA end-binding protein Ku
VPHSAIDQRFFDSPYYVMPSAPVGQEAFAVMREAMRGKGMAALGRLVLSKRERVIALEPYDKGLLGTTLRYPYEVRKAEDYFCDLPDLTMRRTCSRWLSIFSTARPASSTPRPSGTATRRHCWRI